MCTSQKTKSFDLAVTPFSNFCVKKAILFLLLLFSLIPISIFCQWSTIAIPETRTQAFATASEFNVFVVGGIFAGEKVEILNYNIISETWSNVLQLASPRSKVACLAHMGNLYTAGGITFTGFGDDFLKESNNVEIYDISGNEHVRTDTLSIARTEISVVAYGNKIIFAGGLAVDLNDLVIYSRVDIYDVETESWSTAELSEARAGMAAGLLGNNAYFAGGLTSEGTASKVVDIYNFESDSWTIDSLSSPRAFYSNAPSADNKIYFPGGISNEDTLYTTIDIFDSNTNLWTTKDLTEARFGIQSAVLGDKIYFSYGGNAGDLDGWAYQSTSKIIDILDYKSDEWTIHEGDYGRFNHSAVSIGNAAMFVGGFSFIGVAGNKIEVYQDADVTSLKEINEELSAQVYPNPFSEKLNIDLDKGSEYLIKLYDVQGRVMMSKRINSDFSINTIDFVPGIYSLDVTDEISKRNKIIKLIKM